MAKIVYLHQYFSTLEMSSGTRSYEFARRLAQAGHEVHVITSDQSAQNSDSGWRVQVMDGFTVHWIREEYSNEMAFHRRIFAFVRFAIRASARARKAKADVIFATSTPLTIAIPAVAAKFARKTPMVFEVRDLWPELPIAIGAIKGKFVIALARALEKTAYRNSTSIIALSKGMADGVVRAGYPRGRVSIIPNGSDLDLFDVTELEAQQFLEHIPELIDRQIISYVGTFGAINGVGYIVDLAKRMRVLNPNVAFLLVGAGAEYNKVHVLAKESGLLGQNIFILPQIPKREVPALLKASSVSMSVFIPLPEMEANSANKFFDGLASGTAIAINYGGWQRELLERWDAGIHLDPRNPVAAAETLAALLSDSNRLLEVSANARRLAVAEFSREDLAAQFIGVIESAVGNGVKGRPKRA